MRFLLVVLLFCFARFLYGQTCTYLAYDGFEYSSDTPLHGLSGGTGWAAPWSVQNNNTTLPGFQSVYGNGSLSYGLLQTIGRHGTGGYQYLTAGRRLNSTDGGPFDAYIASGTDAIGTQAGSTLWYSVLLRKTSNNDQEVYTTLHSSTLDWCENCTTNKIGAGYFGTNSNVAGQRYWTLRIGDSYYPSSVPVTAGSTVFLVLSVAFNPPSGATIQLYVNPATLGNTTPSPTLTQTTAANLQMRSLAFYANPVVNSGYIDEVRMGTTYRCVAPDNTVTVNLPPVAVMAATPVSGQAPLSVSLNGSTSYDPEGGTLTYLWNFNDGTGTTATTPATSHVFPYIGRFQPSLTVTDPTGLSHTTYQTITVLDQNGTYPCQSSLTSLQEAGCTQNNARIRVNNAPANINLFNSNNVAMTRTGANEYHNLAPGLYTFVAAGSASPVCRDTFTLRVAVDSTTCAGWQKATCAMPVGTNLSGFADWVPERPMRNLMKHVRPDIIPFTNTCNCWNLGNIAEIQTDANGYPTHMPQNTPTGGANTLVRMVISASEGNLQTGQTYVLLYDGVGSISMQGSLQVNSSSAGRIQFTIVNGGNIWFHITQSQLGNAVRNIRLLRLADEFADLTAEPFHETFLDKIRPFKSLRFMDWGATNNNPAVQWSERSTPAFFTYGRPTGVPYEIMIQLANLTNKDVWICVPHAANDNYVTQMAALFRDQLKPGITVYLEYSNEVWNWIFTQAHYNDDNRPANLGYGRAYSEKAKRVFNIWHSVWGTQKTRVKRVLGLQAGFNGLNEEIMAQLKSTEWDMASPTYYFGLDHGATGNPVLTAASTAQQVVLNARNSWMNSFRNTLKQDYRTAKLHNKTIVAYEGGQHFVGDVNGTTYPYQQAMYAAQYTPEIRQLYNDVLDTVRTWGCVQAMNFSLASDQESVYGSWGVLDDISLAQPFSSTAPKYQANLDNVCAPVSLRIKVFLQGPYQAATGLMNDGLRTAGVLPTVEPFTGWGYTHVNGGGGETVQNGVFATTGRNAIVDWIWVELRSAANPTQVVATRSALLQRDGDVVDMDGVTPVEFRNSAEGAYYVAIRHRNHLGFRTLQTVFCSKSTTVLSFTDASVPLYGTSALRQVATGVYAMKSGDANRDGQINAADRNLHWRLHNGQPLTYTTAASDFNFDGVVNTTDRDLFWRVNNSQQIQLD